MPTDRAADSTPGIEAKTASADSSVTRAPKAKPKGKDGRRPEPYPLFASLPDAPPVSVDGISVDLDDRELPRKISERAFTSGGFPYKDRMDRKSYEKALRKLSIELQKLQGHVRDNGERIVVLFEGRDGAGKGGAIHRVTQHLNPRTVRTIALPKPNDTEHGQWYFQRYAAQLPTRGQVVLFDRSWYNRGAVEPVMGFCTPAEAEAFLNEAPVFEKLLTGQGIRLVKLWLAIGREMQLKRLHARRHDPLKHWKLSPVDYDGLSRWDDYSAAADRMLAATDTAHAPWTIVHANDKLRARLAVIRTILGAVDYAGADRKAIGKDEPGIVLTATEFLATGGER